MHECKDMDYDEVTERTTKACTKCRTLNGGFGECEIRDESGAMQGLARASQAAHRCKKKLRN